MINGKFIQLLQTNKEVLKLTKQINSYIDNDKMTIKVVESIYVNYVKECVKTSFDINTFILKLNTYLKVLKKNQKAKEKLNIKDIYYFKYIEYSNQDIVYQVTYEQDKKGFIYLEYQDEIYPVRQLKWDRLKEQIMKYVINYNPNSIQLHMKGSTYQIIIKAPRIKLDFNYSAKKYNDSYWDVDYNIKRHTKQNIAQLKINYENK